MSKLILLLNEQSRLHKKNGALGLSGLFKNAANEIESLQSKIKELEQAQEWISVDDTLPEHDNPILITDSCGWVAVGYYWPYENSVVEKKGKFYKCGDDWHNELFITHWLPLPTTENIS